MRILSLLVVFILAGYSLPGPVTARQSGDNRLTLGSADGSSGGNLIAFDSNRDGNVEIYIIQSWL